MGSLTENLDNSLRIKRPDLANEWNYEKNGYLTPWDVKPSSKQIVWWKCEKGHEWHATIISRSHGKGCPFCKAKELSTVNPGESLADLRPVLATEWNESRNHFQPNEFDCKSKYRACWKCRLCGHEWSESIADRVNNRT